MSPSEADVQRVEHAKRVLAEASGDMLTADWGTLYWIAQQVPQLLDVIEHIVPTRVEPTPLSELPRMCQYCGRNPAQIFDVDGAWCSDEHRRFDRGNEETWWRKAVQS